MLQIEIFWLFGCNVIITQAWISFWMEWYDWSILWKQSCPISESGDPLLHIFTMIVQFPGGQLGLCTSLIGCTVGHKYFDKMQLLFVVSTCFSCKMLFNGWLCVCVCVSVWFVLSLYRKICQGVLEPTLGPTPWVSCSLFWGEQNIPG